MASLPWNSSMPWSPQGMESTSAPITVNPWVPADPWPQQREWWIYPPAPTFTLPTFSSPTKDQLIDQALIILEVVSGKEEQNPKLLEVAANLLRLARQA